MSKNIKDEHSSLEILDKVKLIQENRNKIESHVESLEDEMGDLPEIDKKTLNMRNAFLLDNKLKIKNNYYDLILKYRNFIEKSILDEIKVITQSDKEESGSDEVVRALIASVMNQVNTSDVKIPDININEDKLKDID